MVDFWETFGRMITDDAFRGDLFHTCPDKYYNVVKDGTGLNNTALDIPSGEYDKVRLVVSKVIKDGPVSLMTLGELLMILSSQRFRGLTVALAAEIKATGVNVAGRSKLFYIGLGCMSLDGVVLDAFRNKLFDLFQFGNLTQPERDDLWLFADPAGAVKTAANKACADFWDIGCFDDYAYYQGHTHPLAQPLK